MTSRALPRPLLAVALSAALTVGLTGATSTSTATAEAPVTAPVDGASGIGDPYWPLDGNGGIDVTSYEIRNRYAFDGQAAQRPHQRSS